MSVLLSPRVPSIMRLLLRGQAEENKLIVLLFDSSFAFGPMDILAKMAKWCIVLNVHTHLFRNVETVGTIAFIRTVRIFSNMTVYASRVWIEFVPVAPYVRNTCRFQGKTEEAEGLFIRGLATLEAAHGPEHPDVAAVLSHYASMLHQEVRDIRVAVVRYVSAKPRQEVLRACVSWCPCLTVVYTGV